ncbi:MAG: hypothetical protein K1000chlam3_00407 [Chlamydiae bacterium]|nr:hypothetical protein [Chlamydiota bacterium]
MVYVPGESSFKTLLTFGKGLKEQAYRCSPPIRDHLSSMASTSCDFTVMLFALFSVACSKSAAFISAFVKKKAKENPIIPKAPTKDFDLSKPEDLRRAFKISPYGVVGKIIELLGQKPQAAKEILMNLAKGWKKHPEKYWQYDKKIARTWKENPSAREMRMNLVNSIEDLFMKFILTPEQLELHEKVSEGNLTEEERNTMRMDDKLWDECKDKPPELVEFRKNYKALTDAREKGLKLWDHIYAKLLDNLADISDLHLNSQEEHLEGKDEMTIGHTIERMLYFRDLNSLRVKSNWNSVKKLLLAISAYLKGSFTKKGDLFLDEYPIVKKLVNQLYDLLNDETKAEEVHKILLKIIDIVDPVQKSPPRKT